MTLASFLAVEGAFLPAATPTLLTPRVMEWRPGVWLFDLSCCHSYWQAQAASLQLAPSDLIAKVLRRGMQEPLRAVAAEHPWRALTALAQMRQRELQGILDLRHDFGRVFHQQVSWESWLACAHEFGEQAAALKLPRFQLTTFHRQLRQLQATMERLRQETPWSLRSAEALAMRRRFGSMISLLWEWSFASPSAHDLKLEHGFPWQPWRPAEKPSITRYLEDPVTAWSQLALLLTEDFDRLVNLPSWDPQERVSVIQWHLTLEDLSVLTVPLRFRHPHHLAAERGQHQTAVLQASYSFAAAKAQAGRDLGERGLQAWRLEVEERLVVPPFLADLFGEGTTDSDANTLLSLENQLAVPLERYSLREDWLPESSFGELTPQPMANPAASWLELARNRPFYTEAPRPFTTQGYSMGRLFLERVSGKWWLNASPGNQRDYYAVIDQDERWLWAYRDQAGGWWLHGRFD